MAAKHNNRGLLRCRQPSTLSALPMEVNNNNNRASLYRRQFSLPSHPSDPANVAALLPDFRQPSLASHLTKTTTTAITNREYVGFVILLPISCLLKEVRNSQLHLQFRAQGVTIPLPATSKRPKITSIEKMA